MFRVKYAMNGPEKKKSASKSEKKNTSKDARFSLFNHNPVCFMALDGCAVLKDDITTS